MFSAKMKTKTNAYYLYIDSPNEYGSNSNMYTLIPYSLGESVLLFSKVVFKIAAKIVFYAHAFEFIFHYNKRRIAANSPIMHIIYRVH